MTKKYEKFEEWMIGKKFVHDLDPDDIGVVLGVSSDRDTSVRVHYEQDGLCFADVFNINFLEEAPSKEEKAEDMAIPWEVGQVVYCLLRGKGVVEYVGEDEETPYIIGVDFGYTFDRYTIDGKMHDDDKGRALFFSEPVITAELFPPKKPFVPKLKEGDKVLIRDKQGLFGEGTVRVVHKECDDRIYISEDGDYFMKYDIASLQVIGEEIKWD